MEKQRTQALWLRYTKLEGTKLLTEENSNCMDMKEEGGPTQELATRLAENLRPEIM
jgi:hypothetical protein